MSTTSNPFHTLKDIVNQLEYCNYKTKDELHELKDNAAFILLKEVASKVSVPLDGLVITENGGHKYPYLMALLGANEIEIKWLFDEQQAEPIEKFFSLKELQKEILDIKSRLEL